MTTAEVGAGHVAIVPTFKGFRKAVAGEAGASTKESAGIFQTGFRKAGNDAGKGFGAAFKSSTTGLTAASLKQATADVAKASKEVSAARLKEQDATGKVRVAEAGLADARKRYASDSVQVVRAEEKLATAQRSADTIQDNLRDSTKRLSMAKKDLAAASDVAAGAGGRMGGVFGRLPGVFRSSGSSSARSFGASFKSGIGAIFTGNLLADIAFSGGRQIGRGLAAGVGFGFQGIGLASDLGEALNANDVTFGKDIAEQLKILGSDAPKRLGLSRTAFAAFSTQFSAFAKTIRRNDVTGFIDELTNRGADFASVYNMEVGEALQLFQSGLAGETEPLRKFGLDLSAASVESFAYANGIGEVGTALTEAEKVQARYGLLLAQTAAVQGDNANTSGELAGQQRRLAVAYEESQVALGEHLLPGWLGMVTFANEELIPKLGDVIDKVGPKLADALEKAGPKFEALADKAGPLLEDFLVAGAESIPAMVDGLSDLADGISDVTGFLRDLDEQNKPALDALSEFFNLNGEVPDAGFLGIGSPMADKYKKQLEEQMREVGAGAGQGLADGLKSKKPTVQEGFLGIGSPMAAQLNADMEKAMRDAGKNAGQGFADGLSMKEEQAMMRGRALGRAAAQGLRDELKIKSPSKVFEQAGVFSADGYIGGIDKRSAEVNRAVAGMVSLGAVAGPGGHSVASGGQTRGTVAGPVSQVFNIYGAGEDPRILARQIGREFAQSAAGL